MSPLYDFKCDKCGRSMEVLVPKAALNEPISHAKETGTKCTGRLQYEGITKVAAAGPAGLDGRHQMKGIAYRGEQKIGYVDGHFGKSARRERK